MARAFYDEEIPAKGPNRSKSDKSDNKGIAVVVLDALTRRQWVKEEDLAKVLRLHPKQLRRTLRVLEEEMLVIREHRRETVKGAKVYNAAIAAVSDGAPVEKEGEEKLKVHTHSYCCLDYAQVYDIVRYRIHRARKKIRDELEDRNAIQEYVCPNPSCGRRYSALDATRLINVFTELFHCENCQTELVEESDKFAVAAPADVADGEDNARRRRREKLKDLLEKLDKQLQPLQVQLQRVKDLTPPDFGTLVQWEKRAIGSIRAGGESNEDPVKAAHAQGLTGTPMPFLGETKVEVALAGDVKIEEKDETAAGATKVLPPWMIREGMALNSKQRGEAKEERNEDTGGPSNADVKPAEEDKEAMQRKLQEEYLRAYYAAMSQQMSAMSQQNASQVAAAADNEPGTAGQTPSTETAAEGSAGDAVKKEDGEEDEDDVEWEDAPTADLSGAGTIHENLEENGVMPLEDQGDGVGEVEDDDIDWEEG